MTLQCPCHKLQKSNESIPKLAIFEGSRYPKMGNSPSFWGPKKTAVSKLRGFFMHAINDRQINRHLKDARKRSDGSVKSLRVETWNSKDVFRFLGRRRWNSPFWDVLYIYIYIYFFFYLLFSIGKIFPNFPWLCLFFLCILL